MGKLGVVFAGIGGVLIAVGAQFNTTFGQSCVSTGGILLALGIIFIFLDSKSK